MKTLSTVAAVSAFAMTMAVSPIVGAAGQAVDMQGNVVELDDMFTYGGDNMATYADGKLATGAKDPSVCGTFSNEKCSMAHLK